MARESRTSKWDQKAETDLSRIYFKITTYEIIYFVKGSAEIRKLKVRNII